IDFSFKTGGVITGTIALADGRPAIGKTVELDVATGAVATQEERAHINAIRRRHLNGTTDDRGVYRIYGVTAGDYLVIPDSGGGGNESQQTYYPGIPDKTNAVAVQVKAGAQTDPIDFKLAPPEKRGYEVRRRAL